MYEAAVGMSKTSTYPYEYPAAIDKWDYPSPTDRGGPLLYGTDNDVLYPHQLYGCARLGQDLAYYFVDRLYHHHLSREAGALLAAFIFREVSQSFEGVGLGTDMARSVGGSFEEH